MNSLRNNDLYLLHINYEIFFLLSLNTVERVLGAVIMLFQRVIYFINSNKNHFLYLFFFKYGDPPTNEKDLDTRHAEG